MSLFEIGMLIILVTLCVMLIVNRICKCVEHKATANAFTHFINTQSIMSPNDLNEYFTSFGKNFNKKED